MQRKHWTDLRIPRISAAHPGGIGLHGADLFIDHFGCFAQIDAVAIGVRHFLAIQPRNLRCLGQERLWLRQDDATTAFEVAEQAFAVANRQILLFPEQRTGTFEGFCVTLLEITTPQILVKPPCFLTHLLDGQFGLLFETGFPAVDVIEPPGDLPGEFHMRNLIGADRHIARAVNQNIGRLQQRVAEKPVGGQISVVEFELLIFIARHTLQPGNRGDHRQQQVQLSMLGHSGLNKQRRRTRIDAGCQPADYRLKAVFLDVVATFVVCCESVPVSNEEEAFVLVLQLDPVLQDSVVVAQMQPTRGPHTREHPLARIITAQSSTLL